MWATLFYYFGHYNSCSISWLSEGLQELGVLCHLMDQVQSKHLWEAVYHFIPAAKSTHLPSDPF